MLDDDEDDEEAPGNREASAGGKVVRVSAAVLDSSETPTEILNSCKVLGVDNLKNFNVNAEQGSWIAALSGANGDRGSLGHFPSWLARPEQL